MVTPDNLFQRTMNLNITSAKAEAVGQAHLKKQTAFTDAQLVAPLEEFMVQNPTANSLDMRNFLNQQRIFKATRNQGTMEDLGTDLGIAFGDRLAQTGYGVTGLIGDAVNSDALSKFGWEGVATQQAEAEESEKEYSMDLRQAKANIVNAAAERKAIQMGDGNISAGESLREFFGTVGDYITNPLAAVSEAAKSSADLVAMAATGGIIGGAAKVAVKSGIKKKLGKSVAESAASKAFIAKAGQKAATKAGGITGAVYTGVSEGTNNAIQTRDAILNLTPEVLKQSSDFQELTKKMPNATFEEVRLQFAEEGARDTAIISGSIAALVGKATGAADTFGNVLNKGVKKGIIKSTAKGAAVEAVEETVQSGAGQLVSNIQVKEGDESKDALEGVGESAGAGLAAGGLSGGVMAGAGRTVTKAVEKLSQARVDQNSTELAEAVQELQEENNNATIKNKEPEAGTSKAEPNNVIERYAPERAPVEDEVEVASRTKEVIDTYSNYETDNAEVKSYVNSVLEHTLNTDLSEENLRKDGKDFEAIGQSLYKAQTDNTDLTVAGVKLLSNSDLSEKDAQTIANLATTLNPLDSAKADYNTVAKVINNIEVGDTEQLVMSLIKQKTELGQDSSTAQVDALIETIGDVVLYSEDKLSQLSGETLDLFAQSTQDVDKQKLFEFVSTLRANEVDTKGKPLTGTERVRAELFGSKGDRTLGKHVDTFLTALGKGNTQEAEAVYDLFIGYLQSNQTGKLAALEGLKADPSLGKAVWDTSGAMGKGSKSFTYKGMGRLQRTIDAVSKDLDTLNQIDTLARDILDPEGKKVEEEVVTKPTTESPMGTLTSTDRKGRTRTFFKNTKVSDDGITTTTFSSNRSDKPTTQRDITSVGIVVGLEGTGYEVALDSLPEDTVITKISEIREGSDGRITATVTLTDNDGNVIQHDAQVVLRKKAEPTKVVLAGSGRLTTELLNKDQRKSDQANKFIGFGAKDTSTEEYRLAWGEKANTGVYSADDTVFVSVNGKNGKKFSAQSATAKEVNKAVEAGATIIADNFEARNRSYNKTGEGRLAQYLSFKGYEEVDSGSGVWSKIKEDNKASTSVVTNGAEILTVQIESGVYGNLTEVAEALKNALPKDTEVIYVEPNSDKLIKHSDGSHALGTYKATEGKVYIANNITDLKLKGEVILHELLHSFLWNSAKPKESNTPEQKVFYTQITNLLKQVKKQASKEDAIKWAYPLNNIQEFIVMGMSNTDFINYLGSVKVNKLNSSFLDTFVKHIVELLGVSSKSVTALSQLIQANMSMIAPTKQEVFKVKTKVLHTLTPTDILSGSVLATPAVVTGISEITGVEENVIKNMPAEEILKLILGKMKNIPLSSKGTIYANIVKSGLLTDANKSIWFDAYKLFLADAPFVSSQEDRTTEALKAYSEVLTEEVKQLAAEEVIASEAAAESFTAMNDLLPEPLERISGSVVEQKKYITKRRAFASMYQEIRTLRKRLGQLSKAYVVNNTLRKKLKGEAARAKVTSKTNREDVAAKQLEVKSNLNKIKLERVELVTQVKELEEALKNSILLFNKVRSKYFVAEEVSQKTTEVKVAKQQSARMAKEGKTFYDMEAATHSQYSRINSIAETIAIAKYNLDILAVAIGMKPAVLKAIVRGETKSTKSISQQIADEIKTNILSKDAAKSTVEAYIQDSIFTLGSLVEESLVGKRGGKKRLGIKTLPAIQESFRQKFAKDIRTMPDGHPAKALLNSLKEDNPLKTSLGSFKESALWDMSSILNLTSDNTVAMAEFAEKHDVLVEDVMALVQDYAQFKTKFENNIHQAIKSTPLNTSVNMGRVSVLLIDEYGNIPEHFIQTSFLSYAEGMEYIGHTKYLPRKQLKMYVEKIDRGNTSLQSTFAGKGTFIPDSVISGAVARNTKLVEAYDQNQYLPALNTFLASAVTRMIGDTKGVDMVTVKHNNKSYYGYTRNPEVNLSSLLLKGDTKILKAEYGVKRNRLNHIGTPPNTDYSHLPVKAREMAELTESTPFYLDNVKFELMLKSVLVKVDGKTDLKATATAFVEQYLHEPEDIDILGGTRLINKVETTILPLNVNDQLAKIGKKEGYKAEFTSAYALYIRLQEESSNEKSPYYKKSVPIYYSSFFSANGRQFFEGEVNPQANKLHRILVRTSFNRGNIKVHGSRAKLVKNYKSNPTSALKHYVLALGLGLGVKVDKQSNEISLKETFAKLFLLGKEIKLSKAKTIPEFLAWQREESLNYKAPTVEYIEALDSIFNGYTQKPLPIEVDGKTNGVFHSNWAYGMGIVDAKGYDLKRLLAMGGLKDSLDATDTHHDPAMMDMYQTISGEATNNLKNMKANDELSDDTAKAWAFLKDQVSFVGFGEIFERNASKAGVTSTVYGGSLKALVSGLIYGAKSGEGFLAKFYMDVSAAIGTPINSPERIQLKGWNDVFWEGNSVPVMDDVKLSNYTLTDKQQEDITKHVKETLGKSIDRAISDVLYRSKDVTDQVTMATGTMVALYNMAQVKLTKAVIKKRKLPPTASLSKEDLSKIKQALSSMFPEMDLAIEGLTFLNKRARAQDSKQQQGTTIPVFSVDTESDILAKTPEDVHTGAAPLKEAGVTANPNGIISIDAEMQRLTTKLMKAVTGTLHLNVYDAQDISSGSEAVLGAFITNLAETLTIMQADPVKEVADTLTGVLEASAKPLLFEGEVIITGLNSLLESGTAEFTTDYAEFLNELSTELGGRTTAGDYTNLLGSGDIAQHLQRLQQKLNRTAKQGEISRLDYVAKSDGGIKVHQLAGIDGTAILINSDGSFNWSQMQQESGLSDAKIDKLKTLPEIVEFEKSFKNRIATQDSLSLEVPILENVPEKSEKSHKVSMMEKLAGIILSKGTFKDFSKEKGFTEIKITTEVLKDFNLNRVNLGAKIDKDSGLPASLNTTLFQVNPVWNRKNKEYDYSNITKSNLNGQVIRIVDKKYFTKYGLTTNIKGRHVIEKSAPNAKTGLITFTPIIYIPEGISIAEAMTAMQHELTHANMVGGLNNIIGGNGTSKQNKLYAAFKQDMQKFLTLSEDTLVSKPTLHNLWLVLQDINNTVSKTDSDRVRKEYMLIQEYAAHLNQNPEDMSVDSYLREDITDQVGTEVVGIIGAILQSLTKLLSSLVGSWINPADFPKNNDNSVNRVTLLQAFMFEMGKTSNIVKTTDKTFPITDVPLNSEDRLNNRFTDRSYTTEETNRLAQLRDKVMNAISGLEIGIKELIDNNDDIGGIKKSDTKAYKEFIKYTNVLKDSTSKLRILSAKGALTDAEVEILSQLTGVLSIGRDNKYYQRRHLDKIYLQASKTIKVSDLVPASIKESDPSYVTHLRMAADVHTLLFKTDDVNRVARFAAYSEVSPELKAALKTVDIKEATPTHSNWFEKVRQVIRDAVVKSANALSGIRAGDASLQTQMTIDNMFLSKKLFDNKFNNKLVNYERKLDASFQFVGKQFAKTARVVISKISGKEIPQGLSVSDMILDYTPRGEGETTVPGFWRNNLLEMLKRTQSHSVKVDRRVDIGKSKVDAVHTGTARGIKNILTDIFSKTLTKDESKAIVEGDIKADLGSLIEEHGMSVKDVQMLLEDASTRNTRINILQNQILNTTVPNVTKAHQTMMINEAKALGYRLVQGGATRGMGYPNAYSISRLTGTSAEVEYSPTLDSTLVPMLDQLAALSAIQYMDSGTREILAELYDSQGDAFNVIHAQIKANQTDLVNRYGLGILNQVPKGNTPDITDVNTNIRIVSKSQLAEFPSHEVLHEVAAPHSDEKHYVIYNEVGGAVPYVSGAISLIDSSISLAAKGAVRSEGLNLWDSGEITSNNAKAYTAAMSSKIREPSPIDKGGYVPNLNQSGQIVSYKYELPRAEYTRLAGVSGDWSDMLSEYAGRLQAEKLGTFNNVELVKELYAEYTSSSNKKAWVRVSVDSPNRQVREAWQLAPQEMKDTAKTYFGEPVIYVHRDDINQALGFREVSIKALFRPKGFDEETYMRTVTELMKKIFHPKLINILRKAELGTQEVVSIGKDLVVVKSVVVPAANLMSNINQLVGRGVPVEDVYSNGLLGVNAKREYDTISERLYILQAKLKIVTDVEEKAKLNSEFVLLKQSRESNPLFRLISEEGMNPSVIEELGEESKRDGFRKKFLENLSAKFEDALPENNAFVNVGKEVAITQDSSVYKLLNEGLELGDFVSKFILYTHLTTQEGMSHEDAIEQARSEFINYNRNQNPLMDYANKLGVTPFFKYFMRKHPVMWATIKKSPSRTIVQILAAIQLGVPSLFETSLINKDLVAATGTVNFLGMASDAHLLL